MNRRVLYKEQLCYTDLGMADVSKSAGFGSANNLYLTNKRKFCTAPASGGRRFERKRLWGNVSRREQ